MFYSTADFTISIPISSAFRQQAEQFAQEQPTPEKEKQVYLNTLAVQVVHIYLQMMDISTDLEASDCWHFSDRLCTDVADLHITGLGNLECRPIRAGESECFVPPEVWSDRIGYVVVQIDHNDGSGTILGFVSTITNPLLPINQLQSLNAFLMHLDQLSRAIESSLQPVSTETQAIAPNFYPSVCLSQWFNNIFAANWQTIEAAFAAKLSAIVFLGESDQESSDAEKISQITHLIQTTEDEETRWKAVEQLWTIDPNHPASGVRRMMDLGIHLAGKAVGLMVAVLRKPDRTVAILLRVYPMGSQRYLPPRLQLTGLQEDGQPFLAAESRDRDDYIQLKFCAEPGERFGVRISLTDVSITENFVV